MCKASVGVSSYVNLDNILSEAAGRVPHVCPVWDEYTMEAFHVPQACKASCSDGLGIDGWPTCQGQTEIFLVVGSDAPRLNMTGQWNTPGYLAETGAVRRYLGKRLLYVVNKQFENRTENHLLANGDAVGGN